MTIKKDSGSSREYLQKLRGGRLTIGKMIESIRLADEISQVSLSKRMKISRSHLCDIEKGRRSVSIERAAKFAKVLGYSVNQFIACALEDELNKAGHQVKVHLEAA